MAALNHPRAARRTWVPWLWLLVLPATVWLLCTDLWLPAGTSTISLWYAKNTFDQCSREVPSHDAVYWRPSAAQIRSAEAAIVSMLATRKRQGKLVPIESYDNIPIHYHHQYLGFVRGSERLIYINVLPYDERDEDEFPMRRVFLPERPAQVCDGGRNFWGVVYHPDLQSLEEPEFNGNA